MTKKEKAAFVAHTLNRLYPAPAIPLDHTDPYTLLVAVVLSAQCTDKKVNEVTPELFAKARTPEQMAALEVEEIREIIKPCGVGHKTASVVMSQAFGMPAFPVDTHIHRLAWRWGLSTGKRVEQTEKDLKRLFPEESWNTLHLQIIYFGREHCPAQRHDPRKCPICNRIGRKTLFTD